MDEHDGRACALHAVLHVRPCAGEAAFVEFTIAELRLDDPDQDR